jgi:hypothetical protein
MGSMSDDTRLAEAVRDACVAAAIEAYEQGGLSGLCLEGRWELAVDAMRAVEIAEIIEGQASGANVGSESTRPVPRQ